jgi:hypothetical protein
MQREEEATLVQEKRLLSSHVGRRRIMTTWAIGDAWEEFCAIGLGCHDIRTEDNEMEISEREDENQPVDYEVGPQRIED